MKLYLQNVMLKITYIGIERTLWAWVSYQLTMVSSPSSRHHSYCHCYIVIVIVIIVVIVVVAIITVVVVSSSLPSSLQSPQTVAIHTCFWFILSATYRGEREYTHKVWLNWSSTSRPLYHDRAFHTPKMLTQTSEPSGTSLWSDIAHLVYVTLLY